MGKFNIDLTKVDNEAFKKDKIYNPADALKQGVDPASQLDEAIARSVNKNELSSIGKEEADRADAAQDLNLLLQDENKAAVSGHIAGTVAGDPNVDPAAYRDVGVQLGEQYGTATQSGQAWQTPDLQTNEEVGTGPLATQRAPSIDQQRTKEGFGSLRSNDSETWVNKFAANEHTRASDIESKSDGLDKFKAMGDRAMGVAENMVYQLRGENAIAFSQSLADGTGIDMTRGGVEAQYINGFVNQFAQLQEQGMSQQFVDIMVAARLQHMKNIEWKDRQRIADDANEAADAGVVESEGPAVSSAEQRTLNSENDEAVGRIINKALGIQGEPEIDTIAGAMARGITNEALAPMFKKQTKHVGKSKDGTRKSYDSQALSYQGLKEVNAIEPFLNIVLPGNSTAPRYEPKAKKSKISHPRKYDPSKTYGDYSSVNHNLDVLDNTPFSMSYSEAGTLSTFSVMSVLVNDPSFDKILKIKIDPKTGEERKFIVDDKGEYVVDRHGNFKPYVANDVKRSLFHAEMGFAQDSNGKNVYYNHFFGSNNRYYVDSAIGNFQSSKAARALLEAGALVQYDMSSVQQMRALKAGIIKKFGFDKGNVEMAVNIFNGTSAHPDVDIKLWQKWFATDESVTQYAADINALANKHESGMSISAMVEAVKLQNAIDSGRKSYNSKFLTEIDGVANGVAHNVLQAGGNLKIERATNLFSGDSLNALKNGEWSRGEDVYTITSDKIGELISQFQGKPEHQVTADWIMSNFVDQDGNSLINRDLGKKPMMIFGYGAGGDLIFSTAGDSVRSLIDANPMLAANMQEQGIEVDQVVNLIGEAAKQAVNTEFVVVKKFNQAMASLADFAISRGIDPIITLHTGHEINLGLFSRKVDKDIGFVNVGGVETAVRRNDIDPSGGFDGKLKAASQAGVLGTHGTDGENVGMSLAEMDNQLAGGNVAAQIFDGVMMPPKYAEKYAQQLNKDFFELNRDYSAARSLLDNIKNRLGPRVRIPNEITRAVNDIDNKRKALFRRMKAENIKQFFWN